MANKYFSQLTDLAAGSVASGDVMAIEDISAGETKGITATNLATYLTGLIGAGGWTPVTGSWTYASAATITVPTGAASIYNKGMPIRWKQGGGYKYGNIAAVADTSLTIVVNTDYTVANSAITDMYYSTSPMPLDFPQFFNYTPTGISATNVTLGAQYNIIGKRCWVDFVANFSGTITFTTMPTLPIASSATYKVFGGSTLDMAGEAGYFDNGVGVVLDTIVPTVVAAATTFSIVATANGASMSASAPITWANGDGLIAHLSYAI